jgi:TrkA-N domain
MSRQASTGSWVLIALLAALSLYLGYRGLSQAGEDAKKEGSAGDPEQLALTSGWNCAYGALQHFLLAGPTVRDPSFGLNVARFLAPLILGVATLRLVAALLWGRWQLFHVRHFARGHCVIVGLGSVGSQLVRALDRDGKKVVVIEKDLANPEITSCRERLIPVIVGDASDHVILDKAGISEADHLIAACGDDGTNVNVVFAAGAATRTTPLEALARIDDPDLRSVLQARAIELWGRSNVLLECFDVFDDAATMMLEAHRPDDMLAPGEVPSVLVVGVGPVGQALVIQAARRWQADRSKQRQPLAVTLLGPDATRRRAALQARAPSLGEVVALRAHDVDLSTLDSPEAAPDGADRDPTVVYVTATEEDDELQPVFALHRRYGDRGTRIVVAVRDDRSGVATTLEKTDVTRLDSVKPVALLSSTLTPELLRRRTREIIAKTRHRQYLHDELAKGHELGERPALAEWEKLPPDLQESNRDFADGIGATIEDAGCIVVPSPLVVSPEPFPIAADKLEELAEKEHERWCAAEGKRNPGHPDLVPWSALSEEAREKDRDGIRAIPQVLASAGFELRRIRRPQRDTANRAPLDQVQQAGLVWKQPIE